MKKISLLSLFIIGLFVSLNAQASLDFLSVNAGQYVGNNSYNGYLGLDFNVNSTITVTSIGAWDNGDNGFSSPIAVGIYDRGTTSLMGSVVSITTANSTAVGGYRYFSLSTPIQLDAGFQGSLVATGFSATDQFRAGTTNFANQTGGSSITYVGGRYGATLFPSTVDAAVTSPYLTASFQFVTGVIPEPSTYCMLVMGVVFCFFKFRKHIV